jgi:hypothetical protein
VSSSTNLRDQIFEDKAEEIEKSLAEWAKLSGILNVGERIAFSMYIENVPTVVRADEETARDLTPVSAFFSLRNLNDGGVNYAAKRIRKKLPPEIATMGQFVEKYSDVRYLKELFNIKTKRTLKPLVAMLTNAGWPVTDHDGLLN